MSQYLLLKKISVQNANAIAGLTYGFPAITNFLGFAHALSRKLSNELELSLGGVAVISHQNNIHARQPKGWGDYVFALSRNPLTQQGNTAPINEEGRLSMQVSMLIEIDGLTAGNNQTVDSLIEQVNHIIPTLRLAGGQITKIEEVSVTADGEQDNILRRLMPGFLLIDRSDYLNMHFNKLKEQDDEISIFDAWCDFAKIKFKAEKVLDDELISEEGEEKVAKAIWHYLPKPQAGYLVPINTGYCAISPVYSEGEVDNVRDSEVPVVFAESAYSVGEWLSAYRLTNINDAIWRYQYQYPWYLAKANSFVEEVIEPEEFDENEIISF